MTRIIAGSAGGLRLATPAGAGTRPTSDRVREALFSGLEHRARVAGARVLDLYAGSGALGLEAASRGAREVLLVESARAATAVIRRNIASTRLPGVRLRGEPVERVLGSAAPEPFDLVLIDPPYLVSDGDLAAVLGSLVAHGWVAPGAEVVVERAARSPQPNWPPGLVATADRAYGETRLWFAQAVPDAMAPKGPPHGVGFPA